MADLLTRTRRFFGNGDTTAPDRARSLAFSERDGHRYWWHQLPHSDFVPPLYQSLSDAEWAIMDAWFRDTDERRLWGEANVSAMSILQAFVVATLARNMVQLGSFAGYSMLLAGFMMRAMGRRHAVLAVDIEPTMIEYCAGWVERAGLGDYVRLECCDSSQPHLPELARAYFENPIDLVFIDSSHQYAHTVRELELWYPAVAPGGFVFLHDASDRAAEFDHEGAGGVHRALTEWTRAHAAAPAMSINESMAGIGPVPIYKDNCGLGIIQRLP
jgi:predicted O-methyltransferase YrrM